VYQVVRQGGLGAITLPKFLTPPRWLRNIVGAVVKGQQVTVPTPAGPQTFDLGNADSVRALQQMISGAKLQPKPVPTTGPAEQIISAVEKVPGGWLTIGLGFGVLIALIGGRGMGRARG